MVKARLKKKSIEISIPKGVDTGNRIRLSQKGEAGTNGGPNGDLYIQIAIKPHPVFSRNGLDLICEVPIDIFTATLGGKITVPVDGQVELKIPKGTQTHTSFRLRGKGIGAHNSSRKGDLICKVIVETPVALNKEQSDKLAELANLMGKDHKHCPKADSWLKSIKRFFNSTAK